MIVLNNWDLEHIACNWPARTISKKYVREGGGLLVIGGEQNVYVENKKIPEDALRPARCPRNCCRRATTKASSWC